jgi:hypothetical protein
MRIRIGQLRTPSRTRVNMALRRSTALIVHPLFPTDRAVHTRRLQLRRHLRLPDGDRPTLTAPLPMALHRTDAHQQSILSLIPVVGLQSMQAMQLSDLRMSEDLRMGRRRSMARSVRN